MHFFSQTNKRRGFTLLEIMVVVILIGVLLAMAIPGFTAVRERSRVSAFLNDFRAVKEAINRYNLEEGTYPTGPTGEFAEYIHPDIFTNNTVIGGNWEVDDTAYTFAIGVDQYQVDDDVIQQIDAAVDDGNLATGNMILAGAQRFLFVIEE